MSVSPTATMPKLITGEQLAAMGDIGTCELIKGRIVKVCPTRPEHGSVEIDIGAELQRYVKRNKLGKVMGGEVGIYTRRNPDTVRGADIAFVSHERLKRRGPSVYLDVAPELVVEIKSPDNTWPKLRKKIKEYFKAGVQWVWIVLPKKKAILVYSSPDTYEEYEHGDYLFGEGILEGFTLRVGEVFS